MPAPKSASSTAPTCPSSACRSRPAKQVAGSSGEGVVVTQVDPDGPAAERGFKTGDVILEVGGATVSTPADVKKALADAKGAARSTVLMRVKSKAARGLWRSRSATPELGVYRRHPSPPPVVHSHGDGPRARPHIFERLRATVTGFARET